MKGSFPTSLLEARTRFGHQRLRLLNGYMNYLKRAKPEPNPGDQPPSRRPPDNQYQITINLILVSRGRPTSSPKEHHMHRLERDHGVELERVTPDIIEIVLQLLDRVLVALAIGIIDLRPPVIPGFTRCRK